MRFFPIKLYFEYIFWFNISGEFVFQKLTNKKTKNKQKTTNQIKRKKQTTTKPKKKQPYEGFYQVKYFAVKKEIDSMH